MARSASATDMIPFGGVDEPLLHGGDLGAARRLFPDAPEPFIDLSTGINPNPYPLPPLPAELFARLPEPAALAALAAAAAAYGAPSAAHVVAAPGTQILLPLVAGLVRPGRARFWRRPIRSMRAPPRWLGMRSSRSRDLGDVGDADLVIVANPNNPDGRLFARTLLAGRRDLQRARRPAGGR